MKLTNLTNLVIIVTIISKQYGQRKGKEKNLCYLTISHLWLQRYYPNKKLVFVYLKLEQKVIMGEASFFFLFFETWVVVFFFLPKSLTPPGTSLVTAILVGTQVTWRVFGAENPWTNYICFGRTFCPWCTSCSEHFLCISCLQRKQVACRPEIGTFLTTPISTRTSLALQSTPEEYVFHLCG